MDQQRARGPAVAGRQPAMGDAALVAALRCEDEGALREFFLRFRPGLLLAARRLRVDPGERDALVDDCLADVAVHLITSVSAAPGSLPAYLARSLRNRVLNAIRARGRAQRRLGTDPAVAEADAAASAGCSEHARRTSAGVGDTRALSPSLARLAAALEAPLDDEERLLAVWMSHLVPQAEVASWLGIAPKAAAKRIERLRERLQRAALDYLDTTGGNERQELLAFLGRAELAPGPAGRLNAARMAPHPTAAAGPADAAPLPAVAMAPTALALGAGRQLSAPSDTLEPRSR